MGSNYDAKKLLLSSEVERDAIILQGTNCENCMDST
jgi:hypothetical protein